MISASEARKKTEDNIDNELPEIMIQIEKAISDGRFSIFNDGFLQPKTRKKLEELGYKVESGRQYNKGYYSVSWR